MSADTTPPAMNPDQFHPATTLGYWVHRTAQVLRSTLDQRVSTLGLNATEAILMGMLSVAGPKSLVELAGHMSLTHPSVLRHLDSLEERGLIKRTPHSSDRRIKLVALTDAGEQIVIKVKEIIVGINHQALGHLDDRGASELMDNLQQAILNMGGDIYMAPFPLPCDPLHHRQPPTGDQGTSDTDSSEPREDNA